MCIILILYASGRHYLGPHEISILLEWALALPPPSYQWSARLWRFQGPAYAGSCWKAGVAFVYSQAGDKHHSFHDRIRKSINRIYTSTQFQYVSRYYTSDLKKSYLVFAISFTSPLRLTKPQHLQSSSVID
jgi:hypothetical protein